MEATSITQTTNTIIEPIAQPLLEKNQKGRIANPRFLGIRRDSLLGFAVFTKIIKQAVPQIGIWL